MTWVAPEKGFKMIKKHSILWFYIFTFIFTIILGGAGQALCVNFVAEQHRPIVSLVFAEMAPSLSTLLISICTKDWSFWKNMKWNLFKNIKNVLWVLLSIIIPAAIVVSTSTIMSACGKAYIPNNYSDKLIIEIILFSLMGCIGEEIGWRGFMLPAFNRKYSLLKSAVFTGILWGAWHVGKLASYGALGYILFILLITEFSIIMAWIYLKSKANMICMVTFHLGINATSVLLLTEREGIMFYTTACAVSALICLIFIFTDRENLRAQLSLYKLN